jgi:hypothetical protein
MIVLVLGAWSCRVWSCRIRTPSYVQVMVLPNLSNARYPTKHFGVGKTCLDSEICLLCNLASQCCLLSALCMNTIATFPSG